MTYAEETSQKVVGKIIAKAEITGHGVDLTFTDGTMLDYCASDGGYSSWSVRESATKREATAKEPLALGNAAKMRKALAEIDELTSLLDIPEDKKNLLFSPSHSFVAAKMRKIIKKALEEPPRQCDVGTVDEQYARFLEFCDGRDCESCEFCPYTIGFSTNSKCRLAWAQTPYESEVGK